MPYQSNGVLDVFTGSPLDVPTADLNPPQKRHVRLERRPEHMDARELHREQSSTMVI